MNQPQVAEGAMLQSNITGAFRFHAHARRLSGEKGEIRHLLEAATAYMLLQIIPMNTRFFAKSVGAPWIQRVSAIILLLAVWIPADPVCCQAQGTIYTSRSGFDAALTSSTTITFDGVVPFDPSGFGVSSVSASGVTFTSPGARLFVSSASANPVLYNFDSSYPVGIVLPNGMNAFGADFSGGIVQNNPFNATITINLADGETDKYQFVGQLGSWTFVGFTFSQPITSLIYDDGGPVLPGAHEEMLDNVSFGTAIPEPHASILAVFGLVSSFGILRFTD